MLTITILTLVFALNDPIRKDLRPYNCHIENVSKIPGRERSLNISLQAPGIAATKGKLNRSQKVISLECFSLRSSVQVNLLYLEETHGDLAEQRVEGCTLQSLRVLTGANGKPAARHACVLLTRHRKNFQGKFFLPERERIPSTNGKDMLTRQKCAIIIEAYIACVMFGFVITYMVLVIFEVPFPCPFWMQNILRSSRRLSAAHVHMRNPTAALEISGLKDPERTPLEISA